jgi:hypothetical protein
LYDPVVLGTLIDTPSGQVPVETLQPGDEVVSLLYEAGVESITTTVAAVRTIRTNTCIQLAPGWVVTPRQPVLTAGGWIPASKVKSGESVMNRNGGFVAIDPPRILRGYFEVFDLTISDGSHNYIANGLLCHNAKK